MLTLTRSLGEGIIITRPCGATIYVELVSVAPSGIKITIAGEEPITIAMCEKSSSQSKIGIAAAQTVGIRRAELDATTHASAGHAAIRAKRNAEDSAATLERIKNANPQRRYKRTRK